METIGYFFLIFFVVFQSILVHELGHLLAAIAVKAPVTDFVIGMGPNICSFIIRGIKFSIAIVPIGGYVSFGKIDCDEKKTKESQECSHTLPAESASSKVNPLLNIHPLKTIIISLMGPIFNIIFSILLFMGLTYFHNASTVQLYVVRDSMFHNMNFRTTDVVLKYDGEKITSIEHFETLVDKTMLSSDTSNIRVPVEVKRHTGKIVELFYKPDPHTKDVGWRNTGIRVIKGGFVYNFGEVGFVSSLYRVIKYSFSIIMETITFVTNSLFKFDISFLDNAAGIVGVVNALAIEVKEGWGNFVFLWSSISLAIAAFNLLPILPLDGGHVVFSLFRWGSRGFISHKIIKTIFIILSFIGVLLIVALLAYTTFFDVVRLFYG